MRKIDVRLAPIAIRAQLTIAFLLFASLTGLVGGVALWRLYAGAEEAAISEARQVADTLAFIIADGERAQMPLIEAPEALRSFVAELYDAQGRDVVIVDQSQTIVADAIPEEIGLHLTEDPGDEVGLTIRDGRPRTFVERSDVYPNGIRLLAVPLRGIDQQIIGAVIYEYTPLHDELISKANITAVIVGSATLLIVFLAFGMALVLGHRLAAPLRALTAAVGDLGSEAADSMLPRAATKELADLAQAIERQRHQLQLRVETARVDANRADMLTRLGEMIAVSEGEEELVEAVTATIQRMVSSDGGNLLLLNQSKDRLSVAGAWGHAGAQSGSTLAIDKPSRCPGIRRGSIHVAGDLGDPVMARCQAFPATTGSLLCVPMLSLGQVVGVIHVHVGALDGFGVQDRDVILRVAEQSALALANARLIKTMEGLAMTDSLTGLVNGRFFDPLLERELAVAERDGSDVGLIMLDLDQFKQFNDTHGHPAGDEALKAFARAAQGALRESDVLARYGGEEFVALVRDADLDATALVADKLRVAVETAVVNLGAGRTERITVSAGVASTSAQGLDRALLMRIADAALYQAKQEGRNRTVVSQPLLTSRERPTRIRGARSDGRAGSRETDTAPGTMLRAADPDVASQGSPAQTAS